MVAFLDGAYSEVYGFLVIEGCTGILICKPRQLTAYPNLGIKPASNHGVVEVTPTESWPGPFKCYGRVA